MMKQNSRTTGTIASDNTTLRVLGAARKAWEDAAGLRTRRERYKRFTYGDQWSDLVRTPDGREMTAADEAVMKGKRPLTNNMIRRLVKSVVGRFREALEERGDTALSKEHELNNLDELDSRTLEEFLISGCAIQRMVAERRPHGEGKWVDIVSPSRFFVNALHDPRGWDAELIGMIHDFSPAEMAMRFSGGSRERAGELRRHYASLEDGGSAVGLGNSVRNSGFLRGPRGRCRVFEVWTLEAVETLRCHDRASGSLYVVAAEDMPAIEKENRRRNRHGTATIDCKWELSTCWYCRWIAPDGALLAGYPSPFGHGEHPFVAKFYPMTDGEIHSLVEDVIDQQVYVNRLITLIDHVIGSSAKGALLFPAESLHPSMDWEELARVWASPDGIIPYNPIPGGAEPHHVAAAGADTGARELLAIEM